VASPGICNAQKLNEGKALKLYFSKTREREGISVEALAFEMGISQGLVSQWFNGITAIPDKRMLWLGKRLGFNAFETRPSLKDYAQYFV
jgi:transcriptional regulator with XRE-family HTH domain